MVFDKTRWKKKYDIQISDEDIQQISQTKFRLLVIESVDKYAYSKMIMTNKSQSKCQSILKNVDENKAKIQKCLISSELVKEDRYKCFH